MDRTGAIPQRNVLTFADPAPSTRRERDREPPVATPDVPAAVLRTLQLALAAVFFVLGAATMADTPAPGADLLDAVAALAGAGPWLRDAVGAFVTLGALSLLVPASAGVGALALGGLTALAAGASAVEFHAVPGAAGVLLGALALLAYARRASLAVVGAFLVRNL